MAGFFQRLKQGLTKTRGGLTDKVDELVALIDKILPEYVDLWTASNFEMGIARSHGYLTARRAELIALKG